MRITKPSKMTDKRTTAYRKDIKLPTGYPKDKDIIRYKDTGTKQATYEVRIIHNMEDHIDNVYGLYQDVIPFVVEYAPEEYALYGNGKGVLAVSYNISGVASKYPEHVFDVLKEFTPKNKMLDEDDIYRINYIRIKDGYNSELMHLDNTVALVDEVEEEQLYRGTVELAGTKISIYKVPDVVDSNHNKDSYIYIESNSNDSYWTYVCGKVTSIPVRYNPYGSYVVVNTYDIATDKTIVHRTPLEEVLDKHIFKSKQEAEVASMGGESRWERIIGYTLKAEEHDLKRAQYESEKFRMKLHETIEKMKLTLQQETNDHSLRKMEMELETKQQALKTATIKNSADIFKSITTIMSTAVSLAEIVDYMSEKN